MTSGFEGTTLAFVRELLAPLFPGLIGLQLIEASGERVVASLKVRPDLSTTSGREVIILHDCLK